MAKDSLGHFLLKFGPDSAIVRYLKAGEDVHYPWKLVDGRLELTVESDPACQPMSRGARQTYSLMQSRSPSTAESILKGIATVLRMYTDFPIPRYQKLALADALDRVIEEGESVKFLYGKQDKPGKPKQDVLKEFEALTIVELIHHSANEPYSVSTDQQGAYQLTAELLAKAGIMVKSEDEIRRLRRKALASARDDLEYFFQFIHFLWERGYRITQSGA